MFDYALFISWPEMLSSNAIVGFGNFNCLRLLYIFEFICGNWLDGPGLVNWMFWTSRVCLVDISFWRRGSWGMMLHLDCVWMHCASFSQELWREGAGNYVFTTLKANHNANAPSGLIIKLHQTSVIFKRAFWENAIYNLSPKQPLDRNAFSTSSGFPCPLKKEDKKC